MITQCNPGTLLEIHGSFEIRSVLTGEPEVNAIVKDRESSRTVTLAGLLRSFLEDPDETITGPIRIRIESDQLSRSAAFQEIPIVIFNQDDPAGLWKEGDFAVDVGPEAPGSPVRTFILLRTNETLSLSEAYERHLVRSANR